MDDGIASQHTTVKDPGHKATGSPCYNITQYNTIFVLTPKLVKYCGLLYYNFFSVRCVFDLIKNGILGS